MTDAVVLSFCERRNERGLPRAAIRVGPDGRRYERSMFA
ncbi:MAG: hypothetical protein ACI9TI_002326, partial [Natronomonas sp.]